jgi:hypothetical protein
MMNDPQSQALYTLRRFLLSAGLGLAVSIGSTACAAEEPLPSWNDGPAKKAILEFVAAVTDENGKDYVKPADRTAIANLRRSRPPMCAAAITWSRSSDSTRARN